MLKKFKLHWFDGSENIIKGETIKEAFTKSGFGSVKDLDYYEEVPSSKKKFTIKDFSRDSSINLIIFKGGSK